MADPTNVFDAAKAVAELLKGLEKDRQAQVLRWVAEDLKISVNLATGVQGEDIRATPPMADFTPGVQLKDIKTFAESKSPKSDTQFAAVVAYYYRFEAPPDDRKGTISATLLQEAARLVGRKRFPKPGDTLNNAKKQGYLDSAGHGAFKINSVGENLVAMTLPGAPTITKPKSKPRRKPKSQQASTARKTKVKSRPRKT